MRIQDKDGKWHYPGDDLLEEAGVEITKTPAPKPECPTSPTGKHEADFNTVARADIAGDDHWILDVNCKHCGRSGAFRVDPQTEIDW